MIYRLFPYFFLSVSQKQLTSDLESVLLTFTFGSCQLSLMFSCWLLSSFTQSRAPCQSMSRFSVSHFMSLTFSLTLQFPVKSVNTNYSQHKWYKSFPVPRVWLIFASIEIMTKLCCKRLIEKNIKDNKPPGDRQSSQNQAQWNVDQQLSKVMRAWHQLEPASIWHSVSQRLHCPWKDNKQKIHQPWNWDCYCSCDYYTSKLYIDHMCRCSSLWKIQRGSSPTLQFPSS